VAYKVCWLLEDLRQHFEKYGNISDCVVSLDSSTGRSKGFGFVTFSDTSVVDQVGIFPTIIHEACGGQLYYMWKFAVY